MSQTATFNTPGVNRYRIQPMPRTLNYSAGVDIRITAPRRQPAPQVVESVLPEPVVAPQPVEVFEQEVTPLVQPPSLESTMVMPHYSNLSAEQKAELLARALERYGDPEELVEQSEGSRVLQLRNAIDQSYRSVVVTVTKKIPVMIDRIKNARATKSTDKTINVEAPLESVTPTEIMPEKVEATELISAIESAETPAPKKARKLGNVIIPIVSTAAIVLVVVVCVDTWMTNRNINQSIDERISMSMQVQEQPSQ